MKMKVNIAVAIHGTKYGQDIYIRQIKKDEDVDDLREKLAEEVDFDEDDFSEYLAVDTQELTIDAEACEQASEGGNDGEWVLAVTDV